MKSAKKILKSSKKAKEHYSCINSNDKNGISIDAKCDKNENDASIMETKPWITRRLQLMSNVERTFATQTIRLETPSS